MPTPAVSTTTPRGRPSWRSGWFIRRVMPGQEEVPVVPIPIQRDLTPLSRWCAFSPSIPGGSKPRPVCWLTDTARLRTPRPVTRILLLTWGDAAVGPAALPYFWHRLLALQPHLPAFRTRRSIKGDYHSLNHESAPFTCSTVCSLERDSHHPPEMV